MLVICERAEDCKNEKCPHKKPHHEYYYCYETYCAEIKEKTKCIEVIEPTKKEEKMEDTRYVGLNSASIVKLEKMGISKESLANIAEHAISCNYNLDDEIPASDLIDYTINGGIEELEELGIVKRMSNSKFSIDDLSFNQLQFIYDLVGSATNRVCKKEYGFDPYELISKIEDATDGLIEYTPEEKFEDYFKELFDMYID